MWIVVGRFVEAFCCNVTSLVAKGVMQGLSVCVRL